jgi:hypothetical protein
MSLPEPPLWYRVYAYFNEHLHNPLLTNQHPVDPHRLFISAPDIAFPDETDHQWSVVAIHLVEFDSRY